MDRPKPLAEQIAASIEDVQELLADNRSLSVAFLSRRLCDHEEQVRKQFRAIQCPCKAIEEAKAKIKKLEDRVELASVRFQEMRKDLDAVKDKQTKGVAKKGGE